MTLEELTRQQEALRREVVHLTFLTHGPDAAPFLSMEKDAPERAFFMHLEEQLAEKKAQLHALDTRIAKASSPVSRFREESRQWLGIIWICAVLLLAAALILGMFWEDPQAKLLGVCALLMFLWALWASFSPDP